MMAAEKIRLIFEKCPRDKANDKKLPSDSLVVSYNDKEELKYDIVRASAQVDVFDDYYDNYKNVKGIEWTKGIIHPKTYDGQTKATTPKKKAKRK